jgi:spore maturation protein CgeB
LLIIKIFIKYSKNIIIISNYYQDNTKKKNKFLYPIDFTLKKFLKKKGINLNIKKFYTDKYNNSVLILKFLKFFVQTKPKYIIFPIDYNGSGNGLNYVLLIILKFIFNIKFISISNDPAWGINFLRYKLGIKIFDIQIAWPYAYAGNKKFLASLTIVTKESKFINFKKKNINISYIGRNYGERKEIIEYLEKKNIKINKYGEAYSKIVNEDQYYKILLKTKIVINFPKNINHKDIIYPYQIRGRVFESIGCGCLLFDQKNELLEKFFIEGEDYINYKNKHDLLKKIKYYLKNYKNIGQKIANNAHQKLNKKFSSFSVWSTIFSNLEK